MCRFMVPCAKTHFRLYDNVVFQIWIFVKRSSDGNFFIYDNGIEIFFPLTIPVYLSGNVLISNLTGNIYDMLSSNPIANALAKPIALQLRGAMGYGPDQGPGEFLLALTGGGIDLAEKSDLVLIDGKGVEVKADGTSIGKSGKKSRSGGRLYSTQHLLHGTQHFVYLRLYASSCC